MSALALLPTTVLRALYRVLFRLRVCDRVRLEVWGELRCREILAEQYRVEDLEVDAWPCMGGEA